MKDSVTKKKAIVVSFLFIGIKYFKKKIET